MLIKRNKIFEGRIIKLYEDIIKIKNKNLTRELVVHPGSVVIIPVLNEKTKDIVLIKQFRYAVNKNIFELPAGTLEKNENPLICAKRELQEETGYKAKFFKKITEIFPSPGIMTEKMHLFIAKNLMKSKQNFDDDEKIKTIIINLDKVVKMIIEGKINDAKTIAGILLFWVMTQK
jgi:ADP-ribose pyrophosphatase